MAGTIIDTIRSRIEAVRGQAGGTSGQVPRIIEDIRGRITAIRGEQGGIVERIGERFPTLKRVRGQLEPWERPALFERAPARSKTAPQKTVTRKEVVAGREFKLPEETAIF